MDLRAKAGGRFCVRHSVYRSQPEKRSALKTSGRSESGQGCYGNTSRQFSLRPKSEQQRSTVRAWDRRLLRSIPEPYSLERIVSSSERLEAALWYFKRSYRL